MLEIYTEGYREVPGYEMFMIGFNDLFAGLDFVMQRGILKFVYGSANAIAVQLSPDIVPDLVNALSLMGNIRYIEKDAMAYVTGYPEYSCVSVMTQTPSWGIDKIRAREVHSAGNKGTGIKVCVIDSGVDPAHEDLIRNFKGGYNFVENTPTLMDDCGHGTHVCGIIAATDNSIGTVGVAPEVDLYACRVFKNSGGCGLWMR